MSNFLARHFICSLTSIAACCLATPALALEGHAYFGVFGGPAGLNDVKLDVGTAENGATISPSKGYEYGVFGGYDLGRFRLEAELSQRDIDLTSLFSPTIGVLPASNTATNILPPGTYALTGYARMDSAMLNGYVDFDLNDRLSVSVGAGFGQSRALIRAANLSTPWLNDKDTSPSWQIMVGAQTPIADNLYLGGNVRLFKTKELELADRLGRDVVTDLSASSVTLTLTYKFGGGR